MDMNHAARKRTRAAPPPPNGERAFLGVFRYTGRGIRVVWETSRGLTVAMALLTVVAGLLPGLVAWVGKLIVDAVVAHDGEDALRYVVIEGVIVALLSAVQRGLTVSQSLLRALLSQQVNVKILEKALELDLPHFEDSELYDKMTRSRREASMRPLSLVQRSFGVAQNAISLATYAGILLSFSPWAVLVLALAGLPAFFVEARFSNEAFRLFTWRTPETRQRAYYETTIAREDFVKETQLYGLGPLFLGRYKQIFETLYSEDRHLTLRRGLWGWLLGLLSTATFYAAYAVTALEAVADHITLGQMTMYLLVFKQGQAAFSAILTAIGGMYEDNLYLSNLYDFLDTPTVARDATATEGPKPGDGIRFEGVSFRYPGAEDDAVRGVSFHLAPGRKLALVGENGSGKTTLIKLLTRLYEPSEGRILLDGLDLREWNVDALRSRIGVIFQDFVRYQLIAGENIGVGDVRYVDDRERWREAADKGMAAPVLDALPDGFDTQLGRWFGGGRELSLGQWQKVALSRAFMRTKADILVLDEPTASMDAAAEVHIFDHFRAHTEHQMAILISHRFSTVRMADQIVVLSDGRVVERGDHDALMAEDGVYARLFSLQAAGYR